MLKCCTAWQKAQYEVPLNVPSSTNTDGRSISISHIASGACIVQDGGAMSLRGIWKTTGLASVCSRVASVDISVWAFRKLLRDCTTLPQGCLNRPVTQTNW